MISGRIVIQCKNLIQTFTNCSHVVTVPCCIKKKKGGGEASSRSSLPTTGPDMLLFVLGAKPLVTLAGIAIAETRCLASELGAMVLKSRARIISGL